MQKKPEAKKIFELRRSRFSKDSIKGLGMSYRSISITIFLVGMFLTGGSSWAKEDTAYLTFQKSAPGRPGTMIYTVKKGEGLFDIVRRVTGETTHRAQIIRKYNPRIKNLNLIYPGQKIILPVRATATDPSAATSPMPAPPPSPRTGILKDDMPYPAPVKWTLVKQALGQIGATVTTQGKYYLPLGNLGQITIDCRKIPMVEFADREIVFIDFRNQIPDNLRQLIRRTWKHYAVIRLNPQSEAPVLLEQIIQASNTHTMTRQEQPVRIGAQPALQIPASWTITRKSPTVAGTYHSIALWTRSEGTQALPEPLKAYAGSKGWEIIEAVRDKIVIPAPADQIPARPVSKLTSVSLIDLAGDCFQRLGMHTQRTGEVKIFDSGRDGFDLRIKADLLVSNGNQRLVLLTKPLPNQFLKMLNQDRTEVIIITEGDTRKLILEKSFKALSIPWEDNSFSFSVAENTAPAGISISFSALRISPNKNKYWYFIDFDMDERINGYLSEKMGLLVIGY